MLNIKQFIHAFAIVILFSAVTAFAQGSAFVYQGKLQDGGAAANGTYQFEFKLFDAATGGNQIGSAISNLPATVTGGIFTATLDFGAASYTGAARFLEISVRLNGSGQPYTLLTPRQAVTSTPYAVRALNANQAITADNSANLGGIPAAQYTQTTDPRLSDERNPLPGSANYIQNTTAQQALSNFNISGEGKADKFTAATQFNIGPSRVLTASFAVNNLFAGINAGQANPTGNNNSFFGSNAGKVTSTGQYNSFFGSAAGQANTSGSSNAFFAANAGKSNTTGDGNAFFGNGSGATNSTGGGNAFFGTSAGSANTIADYNSFFGYSSGLANTTGANNAFFGRNSGFSNISGIANTALGSQAGLNNSTGSNNVFLGYFAGQSNTTENLNTFLGYNTNGAAGITNATAIGANAVVTMSNTMVLGTSAVTVQVPGNLTVANTFSANALNSATNYQIGGVRIFHKTGTDNLFAGIDAGNTTTGGFNAFFGAQAGKFNTTGFNNTFVGAYAGRDNTTGSNNAFFGANSGLGNTIGASNSFFGSNAGFTNTSGAGNSFFGNSAGLNNSTGLNNSFFGRSAGETVTSGGNNAFFGAFAGWKTTAGGNSFFGSNAGEKTTTGFSNSFFGLRAGQNNLTGARNVFLGFEAGNDFTNGTDNVFIGSESGNSVTDGSGNIRIGKGTQCVGCNNNIAIGTGASNNGNVFNSIAIGTGVVNLQSNAVEIGNSSTAYTRLQGDVIINTPDEAVEENEVLCWERYSHKIVLCFSALNRASPENSSAVSSAAKLELDARINEQNLQIKKQDDQIKTQQAQIDALKAIVCAANPAAAVCQPK